MLIESRVRFLDLDFDAAGTDEVIARLKAASAESPFSYIVTPNVDHMVRLNLRDAPASLRDAYRSATLCLCDSRVLSRLARWCGLTLPVVTGSDLTAELLRHAACPGDRIAIVGGDSSLVPHLAARFPGLDWVQHQPPMGLATNPAALDAAAAFVAAERARFSFLVVGSPQQEMIALRASRIGGATGTALCVGASLQFLTGQEKRAPRAVRRLGLEWAYRLISQPRRMWRRYLVEGPRIFLITWRWLRSTSTGSSA